MTDNETDKQMEVTVELSGGTELLFGNQRRITVRLDADSQLKQLIANLKSHHLKERPELFVSGESVRPGILVLVNDVDWELLGQLNAPLKSKDRVLFISTLHGG